MRYLDRLTGRHWAWLHFKAAIIAWAIAYASLTPPTTAAALAAGLRWAWLGATVAGAIVSSLGMILAVQRSERAKKRGTQVELAGLSLMSVGPVVFFTTQLSFVLDRSVDDWQYRIGLVFFGYAMVAAVVARLVAVIPRYRQGLQEMTTSKERRDG